MLLPGAVAQGEMPHALSGDFKGRARTMVMARSEVKRLRELLARQPKLLLCHRDADGLTSAALFLRSFPAETLALDSPHLDPATLALLRRKKPGLMVFLDLSIDQEWKALKQLEKDCHLLIIDHHLFERDLNSSRTLYLNPRLQRRHAYISTSTLTYRLLKRLGKAPPGMAAPTAGSKQPVAPGLAALITQPKRSVTPYAWIAAIGAIADYAWKEARDVRSAAAREGYPLTKSPRESRLGKAGNMISSAITAAGDRGAKRALRALLQARGVADIENDPLLKKWHQGVEAAIREAVLSFGKKAERFPGLAVLELRSGLSIASQVSTILAERHPGLTIVVRRPEGSGWKISLRNQSGRVNLNDAVRNACRGIGSGGGHEKAAGAFVTDWETFRVRLLKSLT